MATIHFDNFFKTYRDMGIEIASYLDPLDLTSLARICKNSTNIALHDKVWKIVAGKIGQPIEATSVPNAPVIQQMKKFVLDVKKDITNLSKLESIPNDIKKIIDQSEPPTFGEIKVLQEYRNSRDILVVWEEIAKQINEDCRDLSLPLFKTSEAIIKKAGEFSAWCVSHQNQLDSLLELDLREKNLQKLSSEIGNLSQLTGLDLSRNHLKKLPSQIGNLSKLITLNLGENHLKRLPPAIGNLSKLTTLNLAKNHLEELPPEIRNLSGLQMLGVAYNHLQKLPSQIGSLSQLVTLVVNDNRLEELPAEIGSLSLLKIFSLHHNQIKKLPSQIGNLLQLVGLVVSNNRLEELPAEIGNLSKLKALHLNHNQLQALPPQIKKLSALTEFALHDNRLKELPPEFWNLKLVTTTNYDGNEFSKIQALGYRFWERRKIIQQIAIGILVLGISTYEYYNDPDIANAINAMRSANIVQNVGAFALAVAVLYAIGYVQRSLDRL